MARRVRDHHVQRSSGTIRHLAHQDEDKPWLTRRASQGQLYKRIIDQVIDASRTDFEENGVDNRMIATLQDVS